jgi:hypothetical protein
LFRSGIEMAEPSLGAVAAISAVIASTVGGLLALGGVVVQERLATRRQLRQRELDGSSETSRRLLERQLTTIRDTKLQTDGIYSLIMAWSFSRDPDQLREARAGAAPTVHPRADWVYVDNDAAMVGMLAITREMLIAGRGQGDWERHAPSLLAAYNRVINAMLRQEDRLHDGETTLPIMNEEGQTAFMEWIAIVEQMRMLP